MAVLLNERPLHEKTALPKTTAVTALFAFNAKLDRDTMKLFAKTHGAEVSAAAVAATGQEVLELLHGGLRPQVLVLDALLTKPSVTSLLQEISTMHLDPEPAVLVVVPVPEETAARKALRLFSQYQIMLRPYGMKSLFDEIYRMGSTDDEHRLYHLRGCCDAVLDDYGAPATLSGYHYAERMLLYALYADHPQQIGVLQQYVAAEEDIDLGDEPAFPEDVQARHGTLPGTLPPLRPARGRRALQWAIDGGAAAGAVQPGRTILIM